MIYVYPRVMLGVQYRRLNIDENEQRQRYSSGLLVYLPTFYIPNRLLKGPSYRTMARPWMASKPSPKTRRTHPVKNSPQVSTSILPCSHPTLFLSSYPPRSLSLSSSCLVAGALGKWYTSASLAIITVTPRP